jgi:hypothetical protein
MRGYPLPFKKSPPRRPRTRRKPSGDGLPRRKSPPAQDGAADARFALVLAGTRPAIAATPIAETFSQAEAWTTEPSWDDLSQAEQLAQLEADEAELHRRIVALRAAPTPDASRSAALAATVTIRQPRE